MFLPLGTDRFKRRPIVVVYLLIAVNLAIYALPRVLAQTQPDLLDQLNTWGKLTPGVSPWWTYLTYAFLHASFSHILFNMIALWVFGPDVEDRLGRLGFLALYVIGSVAAGGAHALVDPHPVVGASGAVAAVIGSFLVFFPYVRVKTLILFFFIGIFPITAWWFIAFTIAGDLLGIALPGGSMTAHLAHLGGYGLGIGASILLLAFKVVPREPYDLFTIGRQAARRRAFKAAHAQSTSTKAVQRKARDPEIEQPKGPAAKARYRAQEQLAAGDPQAAAEAYLEMRGHPDNSALAPLGRRQLYEIANWLFQSGDHPNAADAYRQFLSAYEADAESPRVMLMLGLINARFLNDPTEAKRLLLQCRDRLADDHEKTLAAELIEEIG